MKTLILKYNFPIPIKLYSTFKLDNPFNIWTYRIKTFNQNIEVYNDEWEDVGVRITPIDKDSFEWKITYNSENRDDEIRIYPWSYIIQK